MKNYVLLAYLKAILTIIYLSCIVWSRNFRVWRDWHLSCKNKPIALTFFKAIQMLNHFSLYTPLHASNSVEHTISQNSINAQMLYVITQFSLLSPFPTFTVISTKQ